jgi:hypothetical protein
MKTSGFGQAIHQGTSILDQHGIFFGTNGLSTTSTCCYGSKVTFHDNLSSFG